VWAFDTLGHATSGTFPAGGPASAETVGGGGPPHVGAQAGGGFGARGGFGGAGASGARAGSGRLGAGGAGAVQLFGAGGGAGASPTGTLPALPGGGGASGFGGAAAAGAAGSPFGGAGSLTKVLAYVDEHGGGTVAVSSQSSAATAIIDEDANVAGIGGFSGRESDVSVSWLAQEVRSGKIRWVLDEQDAGGLGAGMPGETRLGSKPAMAAVARACQAVTYSTSGSNASSTAGTPGGSSASGTPGGSSATGTLYDCQGDAAALASVSTQQSSS
jgi:hypothetical protein